MATMILTPCQHTEPQMCHINNTSIRAAAALQGITCSSLAAVSVTSLS